MLPNAIKQKVFWGQVSQCQAQTELIGLMTGDCHEGTHLHSLEAGEGRRAAV